VANVTVCPEIGRQIANLCHRSVPFACRTFPSLDMRITIKTLISVAIFIAIFTGFQGGRYFLANRVQELGILMAMLLFVYGAVMTALTVKSPNLQWSWWVLATFIFIAYTLVLPAQRFSVNVGVALLPSLFASREFLMAMLCPALYFLYRLGLEVEHIENILLAALVALIISYLFHYFRMDLVAAYFSPDHTISGLVTYDPWRGYRLKVPVMGLYLLSVLAPMLIFLSSGLLHKLKWMVMTGLLVYVWLLVLQRTMGASLVLATLSYHAFFANKVRLGLLFAVAPFTTVILVAAIDAGIEHLSRLDPETDGVRYKSGMMAWNSFLDYPFFGLGQQSFYTLTEQQLFWHKFYSADLGLLGILFKYGAVGAFIYIVFSIFLIQRMIRVNWAIKRRYGKINPSIFALLIVYMAFTLNIMLVPVFTYIPGITAAALGIALTSIWQHKLAEEFAKPSPQGAEQRAQAAPVA
jgi:hypothetical protein